MRHPKVGDIVHYVAADGYCLAALVTCVKTEDDMIEHQPIGAVVFSEGGQVAKDTGWRTYRSDEPKRAFWHWPE